MIQKIMHEAVFWIVAWTVAGTLILAPVVLWIVRQRRR